MEDKWWDTPKGTPARPPKNLEIPEPSIVANDFESSVDSGQRCLIWQESYDEVNLKSLCYLNSVSTFRNIDEFDLTKIKYLILQQ
ncbi:hypothetical protein DICVIV_09737 [Dictyocaulus viviparus]|uniref:Uncharacterized protein n=1 Tax=Dictyocaulus viviparus TaxID=29172 RepID=A0A0D8XPE4_DICVI|nr:hypothetical protein DICVIV_09737 [Dictyocaulus viviparus]